ncbi:ATP-binding cassette domain-containing protein [Dermabacteraceae bacterium TAE3-ERU27]|nr:ATP-binding cassette domain-containing protein [Dermabacteraceae bacterium TAE3-ERU27]
MQTAKGDASAAPSPTEPGGDGAFGAANASGAVAVTELVFTPFGAPAPTLNNITLSVTPGERVLLLGPSGCGKSTLLTALSGLADHLPGEYTGTIPPPPAQAAVAYLLQQPENTLLAPSVGRDATFGPENLALPRPAIHERAIEGLTQAQLDVASSRDVTTLSGGQQQRLALAGALACHPSLLLLDEPTAMLDDATASEVVAAIIAVTGPRTLIVAEHDASRWLPHVTRVVRMGADGTVFSDLPVAEDAAQNPARSTNARPAPVSPQPPAAPSLTDSSPLLTLRGLALKPGGPRTRRGVGAQRRILAQNIDLTLAPGSLTALVGRSGIGKSTLLRVIAGLEEPAAGSRETPLAQGQIGWLPQNPEHMFVKNTVLDEVLASTAPGTDASAARALLERVGLAGREADNPFALSGGQQRRLAFAAALAAKPELLLLDEPSVGLDDAAWLSLRELLDLARAEGCAVIAATHDARLRESADSVLDLAAHLPAAEPHAAAEHRAVEHRAVEHRAIEHQATERPGAGSENAAPVDRSITPRRLSPWRPIDALNPVTGLAISFAALAGSFWVQDATAGLFGLVLIALLAPLALRGWRSAAWRVLPGLVSALSIGYSTLLLGQGGWGDPHTWEVAAKESLRIAYLSIGGVVALSGITTTNLPDALAQRLHLPAKPLAATSAALTRTAQLDTTWHTLTITRTMRGLAPVRNWRHPVKTVRAFSRHYASLTFALLLSAIRGVSSQALAMDARGFVAAGRRTWALPSPVSWADAVGALVALLLLFGPLLGGVLFGGTLFR